ncbi:hypothetical protein O3G_MSEX005403 [Manduca sexta]|uniref:Hexosyltransferase n=1 Tax=Manduca sexta TaxID=7130 RepID=A0A922CJU5_MANSE|nr:hypothetical protein O3G_MSEX005403 [Manduca sexta]
MKESQRVDRNEMLTIHKILFTLCSIVIIYNYYYTEVNVVCVKDPKFTLLDPQNTTVIKVDDVYDQLIDIKNFSFKINPQPCDEYPAGFLLMIIVSSNPSNFDNRMVIRSTWGREIESTKLVFLVGEPENLTISQKVLAESALYGDIVQGNFKDEYRNMTYKHVMGLKWVSHHCSQAKYVLKTDDDVVVNLDALLHFLGRELSPWGAKGLITCHVAVHAEVQRSDESKWKVTAEEYKFEFYPNYCAGWAILYSQDVVPQLLKAAQNTPYFWIDDVHITGDLAQKIGVARTQLSNLILSSRKADVLAKLGPRYAGHFLFGPPDLKVERINQLWHALHDS